MFNVALGEPLAAGQPISFKIYARNGLEHAIQVPAVTVDAMLDAIEKRRAS